MKHTYSPERIRQAKILASGMSRAILFVAALLMPGLAFADGTGGGTGGGTSEGGSFADTGATVCGFFNNINSLLNMASIAVVTIAVIFSGYQIAFNNKRISEVATILIGGVLIGAAGQIARMLLGEGTDSCGSTGAGDAAAAGLILISPFL